ncbi:MAG: UbiA family prenyltransferase [Candidatus Thermoplasmatota archaeon]
MKVEAYIGISSMVEGNYSIRVRLKAYYSLLRPFTLLAPIVVSISVMIASLIQSGCSDLSLYRVLLMIMSGSVSLALLNGASNALNQVTDVEEDRLSKPYRPLPRGLLRSDEVYILSIVLYLSAYLLSLIVHYVFSLFVLSIMFFTVSYSLYPRMKRFVFWNQIWVAIPRGFLGILSSWSVFNDPFQSVPLAIGCIAAIFLFGGTVTKDVLDSDADRAVGVHTLVNTIGVRRSSFVAGVFMSLAFVLIVPLVFVGVLGYYLLPLSVLSLISVYTAYLMFRSMRNERYENTRAWCYMYGNYFVFALGFATLTIFSCF